MDIEEESSTWEEETIFPPKPLRGPGRPKKGQESSTSSDPKDLRHAYTDSATTRGERLKARNQSKTNFLVEEETLVSAKTIRCGTGLVVWASYTPP